METMLWVVLVVALALAVGMSAFAWRLFRRHHQHNDTRVALLRQMAFDTEPEPEEAPPAHDLLRATPPPVFASTFQPAAPSRRWLPIVVVAVFAIVGAGVVYGGSASEFLRRQASSPVASRVEPRTQTLPLELLSLTHRIESGDLVVTGLIQNPRDGQPVPKVVAAVYVFNAKGEYFASGRSALDFAPLSPGAESPFVVRIPGVRDVSRFRIGFRADDGSVVAHVDRRGQPLDGTTAGVSLSAGGQ